MPTAVSQRVLCLIFLYAIAVGFGLGVVYDVFRIRRIAARPNHPIHKKHRNGAEKKTEAAIPPIRPSENSSVKKHRISLPTLTCPGRLAALLRKYADLIDTIWIFWEDILYALICAIVIAVFIFNVNDGLFRWFALAGAGVGFLLYYFTLGRLVIRCAGWILAMIKTVVGFLCRLIMTPFLLFFRLLGKAGKAGFHALDTQLRCAYRRKSAARGFGIDPRTLPHDAPK